MVTVCCPHCKRQLNVQADVDVVDDRCTYCNRKFSLDVNSSEVETPLGHQPPPAVTGRLMIALSLLLTGHFFVLAFACVIGLGSLIDSFTIVKFGGALFTFALIVDLILNVLISKQVYRDCSETLDVCDSAFWKKQSVYSFGFAVLKNWDFEEMPLYCPECQDWGDISLDYAGQTMICKCQAEVTAGSPTLQLFLRFLQHLPAKIGRAFMAVLRGVGWCFRWGGDRMAGRLRDMHIKSLRQEGWSDAVFHKYMELNKGTASVADICKLFMVGNRMESSIRQQAKNYLIRHDIEFELEGNVFIIDELELSGIHLDDDNDDKAGRSPEALLEDTAGVLFRPKTEHMA